MTFLLGIKIYATLSLLFSAGWAWCGYRHSKRRALAAEYRWWSSRVVEHDFPCDLEPVIRAEELIL